MRQTIYVFLFIILVANANCAFSQTEKARPTTTVPVENIETKKQDKQTVKVDGYVFELEDCRMSVKDGETISIYDFAFPEPCQFSKNEDDTIRTVKVKQNTVIAVESSRPKADCSNDCETNIRGIVINKNSVRLSAQTQKVASCLPFVWDDKMFIVFAGNTEPFPE